MTATGFKARIPSGGPTQETVRPLVKAKSRSSSAILFECEPDRPPRLCRQDLKDPERFHQRLVDWLMKQR